MNIKCKLVPNVEPKTFRKNGKKHRKVKVYLDGSPEELDTIDSVEYELHPSFKESSRVATYRKRKFPIKFWTYGFFDIKAKLKYKDGSPPQTIKGRVEWS